MADRTSKHQTGDTASKRAYSTPRIETFGTVAELTAVGATNPGPDTFPGNSPHDSGSVCPPSGVSGC